MVSTVRLSRQFELPFHGNEYSALSPFSIGHPDRQFSDSCFSFDLLTPWYQSGLKRVGRGQMLALDAVMRLNAYRPLCSPFTMASFNADACSVEDRQRYRNTWGGVVSPSVSSQTDSQMKYSLERLVRIEVLKREGDTYKLRHPALEVWYRMRCLGLKKYEALILPVCPVLKQEEKLAPYIFWRRLQEEAHVVMPPFEVHAPSPGPRPVFTI